MNPLNSRGNKTSSFISDDVDSGIVQQTCQTTTRL